MKVVVIGAGTAGWLAVSSIKRRHPDFDVTILHDPKVKTMGGVGETLIWSMPKFFHDILGIKNTREWMLRTQATFKTGGTYHNIGREDFSYSSSMCPDLSAEWLYNKEKDKSQLPYYLFDGRFQSNKGTLLQIWMKLYNEGKYKDEIKHMAQGLSDMHYFSEYNTSIISKEGEWLTDPLFGHSYHYNAEHVGTVVGDLVAKPLGVKEIHNNIVEVLSDGQNITGLKLDNGETFEADIYIDCSGFKKILASKLPFKWVDCDEYSNNSAIVRPMFYEGFEGTNTKFRHVRNRTFFFGQKNGWSFNVPLLHRSGNGYVFNTRITPDVDKIADEFNKFLGPKTPSEPDFRVIQWKPGYNETFMVGNCMVMGLSWGFNDPYSSSNLGMTTHMLTYLFQYGCLDDVDKKRRSLDDVRSELNSYGKKLWEHTIIRVNSIFRITKREDSEYWKLMKRVGEEQRLIEHVRDYISDNSKDRYTKYGTSSLVHAYILAARRTDTALPTPNIKLDETTERLFMEYFRSNKAKWKDVAKNSMPIEEFYKHFYSDEFPNKDI